MPELKPIEFIEGKQGGLWDSPDGGDLGKRAFSIGSLLYAVPAMFIANFVGIDPIVEDSRARQYNAMPYKRIPEEAIFKLRARQWIDDDTFYSLIQEHGYRKARADAVVESMEAVVGLQEILELYNRGAFGPVEDGISATGAQKRIQSLGFSPNDSAQLFGLQQTLPGVQDVVRFAVREAYNDKVAAQFQLDEDFPPEFMPEGIKRGLSKEDIERYWRAHWVLPSPTQAFQMYHRLAPDTLQGLGEGLQGLGINPESVTTTLDDVQTLLKTQDFSPFWRDRLLALSKTRFTRIDLRRLYGAGLIDRDRVYFGYRELAYTPEDANTLTDFAIHSATDEERGLTRAQVVKLFKKGVLDEEVATEFLRDLGFSEEAVSLTLLTAIMEFEAEQLDFEVDAVIQRFRIGEFDEVQLMTKLTGLLPTASEANAILARERTRTHTKLKLPSRSTLAGWLKKGLIERPFFTQRMIDLGYRKDDIDIYAREAVGAKTNEETT